MAKFDDREFGSFLQLVRSRQQMKKRMNEIESLQYKHQSELTMLLQQIKPMEDKINEMTKELSTRP